MTRPVALFGAGGHGRVIADSLHRTGREICAIVDPTAPRDFADNAEHWPDETAFLESHDLEAIEVAIGVGPKPYDRKRVDLWNRLLNAGATICSVIHPNTVIANGSLLGRGVQLMAGCVVQPGSVLGENVIVNTRAAVDHDTRLGDHVHIAPGAILLGQVDVAREAFIGAGAVIAQGCRVGAEAVVGMNSTVLADVPDRHTVVGIWKG